MSFSDQSFDAFLGSVASKTPAPGGGAVASAVGALSAALAGMVVAYSVGKKNLAEHQQLLDETTHRLERARALMLGLAAEDMASYTVLNELGKLPETDARRAAEYLPALRTAVQIPMAVVAASVDLLRLFDTLATRTNRYLRSDLGIAAVLADATARSSRWNVLINSRELPADERSRVEAELGRMLDTSARLCVAVEGKCGE